MKRPAKMTGELLKSLFKRPATVKYPAVKFDPPQGFRGKIEFYADKCIGCKLCVRDCPSEAIEIRKVGEKRFEAEFNLGNCIFCGQCVDSCNKDALGISKDFELAQLKPDKLTILFHAPEKTEPGEPLKEG